MKKSFGFTTFSLLRFGLLRSVNHERSLHERSLHERGFTLIELLVVVAIIALLTTIGIVIYADTQSKARDVRRKSDIDTIAKTLEVHRSDNGGYQSLADTQFDPGRGMPKVDSKGIFYCLKTDPNNAFPSDTGWSTSSCPSNDWVQVVAGIPVSGTTAWGVCALLENAFTKADGTSIKIYCRFNNQ